MKVKNTMNLENILNKIVSLLAFKKIFNNVIGIHFDGEKLFCVNAVSTQNQWQVKDTVIVPLIAGAVKLSERSRQILMEFDALDKDLETNLQIDKMSSYEVNELIAEKVAFICTIHNWKTKNIAFCLNSSDVVTDHEDLSILPADKIINAVHYHIASIGDFEMNSFLSSFMQVDNEIFMAGVLKSEANKLSQLWSKNDMELLALTVMPDSLEKIDDLDLKNVDSEFIKSGGLKALFAANVLAKRSQPNFFIDKTTNLTDYNSKNIVIAIFLILFLFIFIILSTDIWNLHKLEEELNAEKAQLTLLERDRRKEDFINKAEKELEKINKVMLNLSAQAFPWRSIIIHLGTIKSEGVWLKEIRNDDNKIEIKGEAMNYEAMANYLQNLEKDSIFKSLKPEMKYSELQRDRGFIQFTLIMNTNK